DLHDDGLDRLADVVRLAGDLFAAGQNRFRAVDADDRGAGVEALNDAPDQFTLLAVVPVEDAVAFGLADLLDHHLLGRLGGDAAERLRVDRLAATSGGDGAG